MSDENEELLNVDASPTTVSRKPRRPGKRVNNLPVIAVVIAAAIVGSLIMFGLFDRAEQQTSQNQTNTKTRYGNSSDLAAEFVLPQLGVIEKKPEPILEPPKPAPNPEAISKPTVVGVEAKPETPVMPQIVYKEPPQPPAPKEDPNIARLRQRRLMLAESAINSRVSVQVNGSLNTIRREEPAPTAMDKRHFASDASAPSPAASSTAPDYSERHDLSATGQFSGTSGRWSLGQTVEAPPSRFMLQTGSVIPATLVSGLNSDLPGQIIGQVSQNVYDSATGNHLLVPQGSRLIGEYSSQVKYGQSRVFAVWQRLIFPDGKTIDLGAMPASTGAGYAGLKDRVNNHYVRIFGSALMMSAVVAGIDKTQDNNNSSGDSKSMSDSMSEALGTTFGNLIVEMMRKNMSIAPTIEIRPGFRLNVMLVKDLQFKGAYKAFDYIRR